VTEPRVAATEPKILRSPAPFNPGGFGHFVRHGSIGMDPGEVHAEGADSRCTGQKANG
jgi:hypothetical protein